MFSSFRDKFKAVQNDVILGFQRLTGPDPQLQRADDEEDVRALAGARLLSHYQNQWSRIHTNAERTVMLADEINENIRAVRDRCRREYLHMGDFQRRLTALPEMAEKVHNMVSTVAALQTEFVWAELQLVELEHQAELARLEDRKMLERAKLEAYRRARQLHFDELQISAAERHLERTRLHEQRRLSEQAERYTTFDQLAHEQMEHFRRHRTLDGVRPVSGRPQLQLSLEEVDISRELDTAALDAFLADTTELNPRDPAAETELDPRDPDPGLDPEYLHEDAAEPPCRGQERSADSSAAAEKLAGGGASEVTGDGAAPPGAAACGQHAESDGLAAGEGRAPLPTIGGTL